MARSVTTAFNNPEDDILQVELYKDNACTELYELQSQLTCIANDDNNFNSYRVTFRGVVAAKRSPQQIQREIDEMMGSEVSLEARADDEYLGPPKKYDISLANTSDVQIAAIPYNHPYIAASYWTVTHGLSYFSLVKGCQGVGGAGPWSQATCAASITVTAMSFIASTFSIYQGYRHRMATFRGRQVELGMRPGVARGLDGGDKTILLSHEEYMESVLHSYGVTGKHVGLHKRGENAHTEMPAYQFTGPDGNDFIYTIHGDDNGEVRHTLSFASDAKIVKREPGYEGVVVDGGLDIQACQRTGSNKQWSDIQKSGAYLYDFFYDDFTCLIDPNELLSGNYVSVDLMDDHGNSLITVGMSPFKSSTDEYNADERRACDNDPFHFSSSCVY
ncbi:hypothetical protein Ptr902_00559 [Pyrenophora tritici-repentis]|uniref:Uncharacterized protein n=1 Tax=Pyrenophora tritici-repentis TaxID=45151 RepID=A0A922NLL8_9PLEO|nr:hypothetical protein Alg130_08702 [Pyrenophora tritici-repentis]KAI0581908.1 hypothetical protein Alg215_04451 [Pyrenophora tritici-repentis]KAI0613235.1 hypothetical protein TUN205_02540 [Pyrenophora tritici-repentis]KAI0622621.1 hypothetical protein TUN199_05393 [Pyrenophora tritici-repentis]KAI1518048.1 hypothetical protein Ptr86124_003349 [Pyrenophora tritici-repentis]